MAGITHAVANTTLWLFPNLDWTVYNLAASAAAFVMILVDRMWKKLPSDHPAVFSLPVNLELIDDSVFNSPKLSQDYVEYQLSKEKNDE